MTKRLIITFSLIWISLHAEVRTWTDTQGKTFDADIVWINSNKTVKLKTAPQKTITVPFSTFTPEHVEYLEKILLEKATGMLHPVTWTEMNTLFGLEIWKDHCLWDDPTGPAAERMKLTIESKTAFIENHRNYPLGETNILHEPVYTTVLYGGTDYVDSLSFVFLNQGDIPNGETVTIEFVEKMAKDIEASGNHLLNNLTPVLGEPKRDTIGKNNLREKVCRWDWNGHAIILSTQEGQYSILRIIPSKLADRAGKVDKIMSKDLRQRMASCVERRDNGDIVIGNIPMINQGPKGYCLPATWERYLRYLGIPVDMYQLAIIGKTDVGGGSSADAMINATTGILSGQGRKLEELGRTLEIKTVAKQIDQGMPIMWCFVSPISFQKLVNKHTNLRNGTTLPEYEDKTDDYDPEYYRPQGHICLIIGYNQEKQEIAISDSWGPEYALRWVPIEAANTVSWKIDIIKW